MASRLMPIWNAASHGGGILLGVVFGIIFLVWCFQADNNWARVGVILYLFGMLGSYAASTLYHSMKHHSKWKERLRKWDHAAIYWHIAGSYSPLTLTALREQGYWGWSLFVFVWSCAIAGTIVSFIRLKEHSHLETFCFVGMGLSILVAFKPLMDSCFGGGHHLVDCRGGELYYGCRVLFVQQKEIHALRIPFLCPGRSRLSYHRRLGRADGSTLTT